MRSADYRIACVWLTVAGVGGASDCATALMWLAQQALSKNTIVLNNDKIIAAITGGASFTASDRGQDVRQVLAAC